MVETTTDHPVAAWVGPIETVSNSEAGFELVYQGSSALLVEPLRLAPGRRWTLHIAHQVRVATDRNAPAAIGTPDAAAVGSLDVASARAPGSTPTGPSVPVIPG